MNKIQHINVGGHPFSINEDAFHKLDQYLVRLNKHFSSSDGAKEIMEDIESRIAELFKEYLLGGSIVTLDHVDKMIGVMGTPDRIESGSTERDEYTYSNDQYRTGKRLFRDPYDKKISGVCSGIAHYFGIEDPTWVRVAFVFFGIWGFGILLYILLIFLVPQAYSPADRLAMKGEPINIQNIADKVEEEIEEMTDNFHQWREKWKNKKKKRGSTF
jgi:phage shock protein PspC (stress-responsive transcriptional regulator)